LKYRTYVRISFEDDEQRSKPATCWQLWKEGRGSSEAHQRDGKLLAVEYVDPSQGGDSETRHPQIQLENALFDGFCLTWTPNPVTGSRDCAISVRFNFLSTDFSHSKGVKGIPVRLCAKTEILSSGNGDSAPNDLPEVCYCKVKLFRDHGAERKLSNDVAHVKKMIDKLKQQITQAEIGSGHFDKRKRSCSSTTNKGSGNRTIKVPKHKRTWSIDSQNSSGNRTLEEDLHMKLTGLKDMFSSTRPVSTLNLRGDPQDDPDLFPVYLGTGESHDDSLDPLSHQVVWESSRPSADVASSTSNILSPATSNNSLSSSHQSLDLKHLNFHHPSIYDQSRHDSMDWSSVSQPDSDSQARSKKGRVLSHPVKVQKVSNRSPNASDGWIEAMDVDTTYVPPIEFPKKPAACFYVQVRQPRAHKSDGYYHAIYLAQRTAKDLIHTISMKCNLDPGRIVRAICVHANGLNVVIDDDVVRELPEGQDMVVEFSEMRGNSREPDSDGNFLDHSTSPSVMKLIF